MSDQIHLSKQKRIIHCMIFIMICYCISLFFLFHISLEIIFRFIVLNIISVFLPGLAIISILHVRCSEITLILYSYAIGYALIIPEYFFAEIFSRKISFQVITYAIAILSVFWLCYKAKKKELFFEYKEGSGTYTDIIFFIIFLILSVSAYSAHYLSPDVCGTFMAPRDMQFWVNNTAALKISFPPSNLYMYGSGLNYHYFSNIPIAFLSSVYGIDIFTLSFPLYSLTKAFLMAGSVHFLLNTVGSAREMRVLGYLLALFTTGAEQIVVVTYLHHTLLSPFGFDISYAYGIYFVSLLIHQWKVERKSFNLGLRVKWTCGHVRLTHGDKNKEFDRNCLLLTILFWSVCVGAKGPVGTVLLLLPALLCLFWLVKKQWLLAFGYGISILAVYLLICKYCIGMFSVMNGQSSWQLSGFYTFSDFISFPETDNPILEPLIWLGQKNIVFAVIVKCFLVNPALIWFGIFSLFRMCLLFFKGLLDKRMFYLIFSLSATAVFGFILWMLINAGGYSEMYFGMSALIPVNALVFLAVMPAKEAGTSTVYIKNTAGALLVLCCIYAYCFSSYAETGAVWSVQEGINKLADANKSDCQDTEQNSIRRSDTDALKWIRDNTPLDSIVLSDKAVITENTHYYLYGLFCERQQYLEGTDMLVLAGEDVQNEIQRRKDLISDIYNNGGIEKAREEGVDYIVQTKDITPGFIYDPDELILVTSTETMNIYQVRNSTGGE